MDQTLVNLNHYLADLYPFKEETLRLARAAGMKVAQIRFSDKPIDNWFGILRQAELSNKVDGLLEVIQQDNPEDATIKLAREGGLSARIGPLIGDKVAWHSDDSSDTLEKIMGKTSTLLPINFLAKGVERADAVALIEIGDESGTGFVVQNNFLVTNNHVIKSKEEAQSAVVRFRYEEAVTGRSKKVIAMSLDPDNGFATSEQDDWTVVRLAEDASQFGHLTIAPNRGIRKNERVNIIQHPSGGHKQIALYHNIVTFAGKDRLQYLTDTMPGSSGSPVFNEFWEVVAVHHSGGWIREPGGSAKDKLFRNEGIHVKCLLDSPEAMALLDG